MLKRKIDQYLIQWKNNPDRLPLIIKGARQIGKTFSIEHFAKNYKTTATNLEAAYENGWYLPTVAELFDIWKVKATVDAASSLCGGSQFGNSYYRSSSQYASNVNYACLLDFYGGDWYGSISRTSTTVTFVQCGLSTSERACSGFNYLSILFSTLLCKVENPKKKSKISPLAYVS